MKTTLTLAAVGLFALTACQREHAAAAPQASAADSVKQTHSTRDLLARGEYLVRTTGCNDCHTAGYAEAQGEVDKAQWLMGSPLGFRGPWGTTYPSNLRLKLAEMTEQQWLDYSATLRTRPLMPDFALRAMAAEDRRAIFHFVRSLGPGGQPAPAYVPPGQIPQPPYFDLVVPSAAQGASAGT